MKLGIYDVANDHYHAMRTSHVRVGSNSSCDIVLNDNSVADVHAEIHISDVGIELHHKGRDRGTWVNEQQITRYFLASGDEILFGQLKCEFVISEQNKGSSSSRTARTQKHGRTSGKASSQSGSRTGSRTGDFNDPYGLLKNLDKGDDLTRSLEKMPDLVPIAIIARGAQGVIHKMRYKGQLVAVKRLRFDVSSNAKERFLREVKALRRLNHPSLVSLIDSIEHDRTAYLIMEFIDGPSLEKVFKDRGTLPVERALKYMVEVAEGLVYLASQGIIHRDIKPSNVLIDDQEHARLVDFGLVRFAVSHDMLTAPGQMVGSPSYMSPEQVRAQNLTSKSDIFSLGVTFFEALTGGRPFPGNTPIELFTSILEDPPPVEKFTGMPCGEDLKEIFLDLLAKDPEERPTPERALRQLQDVYDDIVAGLS